MSVALKKPSTEPPSAAWRTIPPRMRVLYIANRRRTGGWLAEAFAADSASKIDLEEALGTAAGLSRLRDEVYDAVLVAHEPGELDALDLVEGYRAGGSDEPIVVLGLQSEQEMAAVCYEVGADAYLCANTTTTRNLIWTVARALQRHQLIRENRRLNQAERQRIQREHDEARRLLAQQWALIFGGQSAGGGQSPQPEQPAGQHRTTANQRPSEVAADASDRPSTGLPGELVNHYRELLRTYVIMGSGNLAGELERLAELLATAGVTARHAMRLHLHALEELIHGLGTRSTRHVMTRADLLVLEIIINLAESYHRRYRERVHPPVQQLLPGFDEDAPVTF